MSGYYIWAGLLIFFVILAMGVLFIETPERGGKVDVVKAGEYCRTLNYSFVDVRYISLNTVFGDGGSFVCYRKVERVHESGIGTRTVTEYTGAISINELRRGTE